MGKKERKSPGGRKPFDVEPMFNALTLQTLYSLADDALGHQIRGRLSKLNQRRLLDAAAQDLRQGGIQVPSHIPATEDEQLKWMFIVRPAKQLGEAAFDRALERAFQAETAA